MTSTFVKAPFLSQSAAPKTGMQARISYAVAEARDAYGTAAG
jgi:hypothetical protein